MIYRHIQPTWINQTLGTACGTSLDAFIEKLPIHTQISFIHFCWINKQNLINFPIHTKPCLWLNLSYHLLYYDGQHPWRSESLKTVTSAIILTIFHLAPLSFSLLSWEGHLQMEFWLRNAQDQTCAIRFVPSSFFNPNEPFKKFF